MTNSEIRAQGKDSYKKKTPKTRLTVEAVLEELEQSGRRLRKSSKGHRGLLRDTLQTAQRIIVKFTDHETLQKQFVHAVREEKKKGRKEPGPCNWCLEVVAKATGASTRSARKLASKRAGVLEFLRERKIPVNDTAATLKKEGLEKLYSEWCKRKKGGKAPPAASQSPSAPDREVPLILWIKRSERDRLLKHEVGAKLTILVSRVSESDGDFQVKGIMGVSSLGEGPDDWAD